MQSRNIVFIGKDEVTVSTEVVREPGPGEVLIRAKKTLISTGTEGICLSRLFEAGSHWDRWVKYPFYPGYSMVGQVAAVGSNPPATSTDHAYWSKQRIVELFFTYLLRRDMRVSDLVTHRYSPLDAAEAYRMLREERMSAMGVLFDWTLL
jgi:hypothetical protein